jgi:hypothetical protein
VLFVATSNESRLATYRDLEILFVVRNVEAITRVIKKKRYVCQLSS